MAGCRTNNTIKEGHFEVSKLSKNCHQVPLWVALLYYCMMHSCCHAHITGFGDVGNELYWAAGEKRQGPSIAHIPFLSLCIPGMTCSDHSSCKNGAGTPGLGLPYAWESPEL